MIAFIDRQPYLKQWNNLPISWFMGPISVCSNRSALKCLRNFHWLPRNEARNRKQRSAMVSVMMIVFTTRVWGISSSAFCRWVHFVPGYASSPVGILLPICVRSGLEQMTITEYISWLFDWYSWWKFWSCWCDLHTPFSACSLCTVLCTQWYLCQFCTIAEAYVPSLDISRENNGSFRRT